MESPIPVFGEVIISQKLQMFLFRKGIQTPLLRTVCRHHSILKEFSFPKRTFAAAQRQLDFITSEAVDKDQLTPALQQYFKFKEEYKGCFFLIYFLVVMN